MTSPKAAPNSPEALQAAEAERITRFRRAGEDYLREAHARISEAQSFLLKAVDHFPVGRVREEVRKVSQEMSRAKAEFDRKSAEFREKYLARVSDDGEFRSHLALLELQYEGRVKAAETGVRLLLDGFDVFLRGPRERVEELCDRSREALGTRLYPVHAELLSALQQEIRRHDEQQRSMEVLRAEKDAALENTRRETSQIQELAQEISRLLSKERQEAAAVRREYESDAQALRGRVEKLEAWLKAAELDRDKSWAQLDQAQKESGQLREQTLALEGQLREAQARLKDAEHRALETARKEAASKVELEFVRLRAGLKAAEDERAALRAALKGAEAERAALRAGLKAAEAERATLLSAFEKSETSRREAEASAHGGVAQGQDDRARLQKILEAGEAERAALRAALEKSEAERVRAEASKPAAGAQGQEELDRLRKLLQETRAEGAALRAALAGKGGGPGAAGQGSVPEAAREIARLQSLLEEADREKSSLKGRLETLEKRLKEAEAAREKAWESVEWARKEGDVLREKVQELMKRSFSSDNKRDRELLENASHWATEKAELLEKMGLSEGQLANLRAVHEQSNRDWEQALAAQDAKRLDEIFQLRVELQKLKDAAGRRRPG